MINTALLVIDKQLGNFPDPVYESKKILSNIKSLIDNARNQGVPIFYIQNKGCIGNPD
jgi:nicotinamidase-related amidase